MKVFEILRPEVQEVTEQQVIARIKNFDWKSEFSEDVSRITWGMRELELIENMVYQVYKQSPEKAIQIWNEFSPEGTGDKSIVPSFILRLESQDVKPKKPTLQEALGLDWVFDLKESLDGKFDSIEWKGGKKRQVGTGKIGDETFEIYLEPRTYPIEDTVYKFINVAFAKIVDGIPSEKLQFNSRNASIIVGAISNALVERVSLYDFDAVIFIASDNIEDRMRIYNMIADRKWTRMGLGEIRKDIRLTDGSEATVLVTKEIARHRMEQFEKYLNTLKK